jgi:hypothetical protein
MPNPCITHTFIPAFFSLLFGTPPGAAMMPVGATRGLTSGLDSQGRRIPQNLACEDPTAWEILEVCLTTILFLSDLPNISGVAVIVLDDDTTL